MMSEINLQQALWNSNFDEIEKVLSNNPKEFETINSHNRNQFFTTLIKKNKFTILELLINNQIITTDLYEYDTLDNSFFAALFSNLNEDEESLAFFESFLSKIENNNDAVSGKRLIQLALISKVKPVIISQLIASGCNANYKDNSENTYLHTLLKQYGVDDKLLIEYIQLFINEGVDIESENIINETPLFVAVKNNKIAALEILLDNGANANHQNKNGESVFYECIANKRSLTMLEILCRYNSIDFEKVTKNEGTILFDFLRNSSDSEINILTVLIDQGADFNQESLHYQMRTPLTLLPEMPTNFFEKIIDSDVIDIQQQDNSGNTILHYLCSFDINYDELKAKELYKKVKYLLSKNVDVEVTNHEDKTPMQLALIDNLKEKIVALILNSKK